MGNKRSRRLAGLVAVLRATVAIVTFGAGIESAYANPIGSAVYDQLKNEPSLLCPSLTEPAAKQPLSGRFDCKEASPAARESEPLEVRPAADGAGRTSSPEYGAFGVRRPPPMHSWP
jgi:hypothetical protein